MELIRRHGWWAALAAAGLLLLWPHFSTKEEGTPVGCADIVSGCGLPLAGATVRFDRQPDALQRFHVEVVWPRAGELHASFRMLGMEMGYNRYRLIPMADGRWQAEVMLPACIQGRKDWLLMLEAGETRYQISFTSR